MSVILDTAVVSPISEWAIIVDPDDNVAVVKSQSIAGQEMLLPGGRVIEVRDAVAPGHRFSTCDIPAGEFVRQFGQPIGTSRGIREGEQITVDRMSNDVPVVRHLREGACMQAPDYVPASERATIIKLASNTPVFERMSRDLDLSAGSVIDGTETIDEVGARVFEQVRRVASGEVLARAEENKHHEFQFWAEQTVSL